MSKFSTVKLGIFITLGLAILVIAVFMIGDKNSLFSSTFKVKAYFSDIQGLKEGASVRLSGIDVGSVSEIQIIGNDTSKVVVVLDLVEDIKRFIKIDTKASIETEGLVGNKIILLKIGSSNISVKDGGSIQTQEPVSLTAIIEETQGIMNYTKSMTQDLSEIMSRINRGEGTLGKILNDETLYSAAVGLTISADSSLTGLTKEFNNMAAVFTQLSDGVGRVVANVDRVVINVDSMINGVKSGRGMLGSLFSDKGNFDSTITRTLVNVEKTTEETKLAASRLAENMEALKHNWLFKSYYEKRGYWNAETYEEEIDSKINLLDKKIKELDDRIKTINDLKQNK